MPPQGPQNYDFIMNPAKAPKKSLLPAGNSKLQRIAIMAGIGGVLLLVVILFAALLGGGDGNRENLLKAAQQQTELVRVAGLANTTTDQTLKNFAANTSLAIASDKQQLANTLSGVGIVFKEKDLGLGMNQETDQALEAAKAAANFDVVMQSTLTEQLQMYQATLQQAFDASGNDTVKNTLSQAYTNAGMLLKQVQPQTEATTTP